MFNTRHFTRFSGLILLFNLLSCAPASEYVKVKIITPIGMGKKFQNLSEDILNFNMNPATCTQSQLYVGTSDGIQSDRLYNKKIKMSSQVGACTYGIIDCLQTKSTLNEPIEILVLKGKPVDIGIIGAFYLPYDTYPADGTCDVETAIDAVPNFSMIGHSIVNIGEPQSVNLNTYVIEAYQSSTPNPANYSCFGDKCADDELLHVTSTDQDSIIIKKMEYFFDAVTSQHVEHYIFKNINVNADFYVPHILPLTITYDCVSPPSTGNVVVVNSTSNVPQTVATCYGFNIMVNGM